MLLMTPGPTPVPEFIRQAMSVKSIHHRTPEFEEIFLRVRVSLKTLLRADEVLMLASTGTGAMEAAMTHFCRKRALTINAGKFGERLTRIAKAYGKDPLELSYSWDTPPTVEEVRKALAQNPDIDASALQICESAGGLRLPAEEIAAEAKRIRPGIFVIADAITAMGVEPIDTTHIDALIGGSQKAFMLPPGLAILALSKQAVALLDKEGGVGFYFNLATELKNQRKDTTAWTATTTIIQGLDAMLTHIATLGADRFYAETQKRHEAGLDALRAIGLLIYPKVPARSMLTVYHEEAAALRKWMKNRAAVNAAGGQDDLKDKLIRINNMGLVEPMEIAWAINALELALDKAGARVFDGAGSKTFSKIY